MARQQWIDRTATALALGLTLTGCSGFKKPTPKNFTGALKGLFLHVELIQPRRSSGHGRHNDAQSPNPAFTPAQYDRLALLYVIASVRSQHWLIPAYHAALDADIPNGHDDPLNFDPESFAESIETVVKKLQPPDEMRAANRQ